MLSGTVAFSKHLLTSSSTPKSMVFSGIVQAVGQAKFDVDSNLLRICTEVTGFWNGCAAGDSIAVNGCCLTLLEQPTHGLAKFFVGQETRSCTNLASLAFGGVVNLEKSLKFGEPNGGHIVSGHIDGIGILIEIVPHSDGSKCFWIDVADVLGAVYKSGVQLPFVRKGCIAINGVSLTVAEVDGTRLRVSLMPFTLSHTQLHLCQIGENLNIEFDHSLQQPNSASTGDDYFMRLAIAEAEKGRCSAPPNPWVGCVIVSNDKLIGKGFHRRAGDPHAEPEAVNNAIANGFAEQLNGATLYMTLEPCSHYGRTPPCAELIIKHKFGRVVVSVTDPDEKVNGKGISMIRAAGIPVDIGVLELETAISLRPYIHHRRTGLPWIIAKVACSLDGKICDTHGNSKWITGNESRHDAQRRLRATSQAILVGSGTVKADDPRLTVRFKTPDINVQPIRQPLRVIVTSDLLWLTPKLAIFKDTSPVMIYTKSGASLPDWISKNSDVEVLHSKNDSDPCLKELVLQLGQRGVIQVLVEGGAKLLSSFLDADLVNELVIYQAPILLGPSALSWNLVNSTLDDAHRKSWILQEHQELGPDLCFRYIRQ